MRYLQAEQQMVGMIFKFKFILNLASSTRGSARKAKQQKDRDEASSPPAKRRMDKYKFEFEIYN
jgi:hypothetical protein